MRMNDINQITSIFYNSSSYLVKHLNYSYFGGVIGSCEVTFKKAKIIPQLLLLNKSINDQGELILEKAFLESKTNSEIRQTLTKGFRNIVTWLFMNSGEHSGPIKKYVKSIESQLKNIIQIASDTKDCELIRNVLDIYKMLMKSIEKLIDQGKIPLALAFSKAKSIHSILASICEYLLVSEEIVNDFVFNQNGLDYFLNQLLSKTKSTEVQTHHKNDDEEEKIVTSKHEVEEPIPLTEDQPDEEQDLEEDLLNDELFEYVSNKFREEQEINNGKKENKKDDHISIKGQNFRKVTSGDFVPNEFARTMTLIDSQFGKGKDFTNNLDWSVNKKGYRQRIVFKKFDSEKENEIWMVFKLNRVIEIKEIQVGFTNFWTVDSEVYIEPSSVIVETGLTENETNAV